MRRGERENALKCMSNGGTIPLGYRVGKNKHFEIDEAATPIVKELFQGLQMVKHYRKLLTA